MISYITSGLSVCACQKITPITANLQLQSNSINTDLSISIIDNP